MKKLKGITKRGDKWQVRTTHKRKPIYGQFLSRRQAEDYLKAEVMRIDMGYHYKERKTLEAVYLYLDNQRRGTGKKKEQSSTVTDNHFYNHIAVSLNKDRFIDEFTEDDIYDFQIYLKNSGLAKSTQGNIIGLLKQIFRTAKEHRWTSHDYTALIDKPKVEKRDNKTFTDEQVELLYERAEMEFESNPNILGMLVLGLYGGLRIGEMRGLQWKDIDFENHILHVVKQYHCKLHKYTDTKTKDSVRHLGMLPPIEAMLKRIYDRAREQEGFKDTDSVLTSWHGKYTGKPLSPISFYETLGRFTVRCGLPKERRIHVLRKTCGTNIVNKYGLGDACSWLGHAKPNTTWISYTNKDSVRKDTYDKMKKDYLMQNSKRKGA